MKLLRKVIAQMNLRSVRVSLVILYSALLAISFLCSGIM